MNANEAWAWVITNKGVIYDEIRRSNAAPLFGGVDDAFQTIVMDVVDALVRLYRPELGKATWYAAARARWRISRQRVAVSRKKRAYVAVQTDGGDTSRDRYGRSQADPSVPVDLRDALDCLPAKHREALVRVHLHGDNPADVAKELGYRNVNVMRLALVRSRKRVGGW